MLHAMWLGETTIRHRQVQCSLRTTAIQILAIPDRRQIGVQP
jgi:hypothetical protein